MAYLRDAVTRTIDPAAHQLLRQRFEGLLSSHTENVPTLNPVAAIEMPDLDDAIGYDQNTGLSVQEKILVRFALFWMIKLFGAESEEQASAPCPSATSTS
jgi:hypothetical protein